MQILRDGIDLESFLEQAARAPERILILDYDGTLSPHRLERDRAVPYPGIRSVLGDLLAAATCRTVIVSGRTIADLKPLLGLADRLEIWGCHGWERMKPGGQYNPPDLPQAARAGIEKASTWAREAGYNERIEDKAASVAMHMRDLSGRERNALEGETRAAWQSIADATGLLIHEFNGGLELRPSGMNKGLAVGTILAEAHPQAVAAYLGDDMTDEDAFRAIDGRGLGILVSPQRQPTAAAVWIEPPAELLWFLRRWAGICGEA